MGALLPTLELAWLAYLNGRNKERVDEAHRMLEQAERSSQKVAQALQIKQRLDIGGSAGAERMREWYAALNRSS